ILLKDDWYSSPIKRGDVIHLISPAPSPPYLAILSLKTPTLLVLHPDLLLSSTKISDSSQCVRKPILQEKFRSNGTSSMGLLIGNLGHEVIQRCLQAEKWDEAFVDSTCEDVCKKEIETLWSMGLEVDKATFELKNRIGKAAAEFGKKFVLGEDEGRMVDGRATREEKLKIERVFDVEEDVWSPKWGLKGKIDASVKADVQGTKMTLPLEIKTGKSEGGLEHRAQTMLYTLLMSERYGEEIASGLLYYTQSGSVHRVWGAQKEIRGLVQSRNRMAHFMHHSHLTLSTEKAKEATSDDLEECWKGILPRSIDEKRACERCYVVDSCLLYRRKDLQLDEPQADDWLIDLYKRKTSHLTNKHTDFFRHWEELISLEEREGTRSKKEIWTMAAGERANHGRCLAEMVLDSSFDSANVATNARWSRFVYRFTQDPSLPSTSLLSGHLTRGDPIVVSIDGVVLAFARGFILDLNHSFVTLGLDRQLKLPERCQGLENTKFRIDRDELGAGMGRVRDNLAQLFYDNGDERRRRLIVDLEEPRFTVGADLDDLKLDGANDDQKAAVMKVLKTEDYALLLGMPGTGKTTTIAKVIEILAARGKTILLTSYTHSAVDTILEKVKDSGLSILRIGNPDKVAHAIQRFTISPDSPATSIEALNHQLMTPQIVATTCLAIDQYSIEAREKGLDISLFKRLSDAHPQAIVYLTQQYRMNADIMEVSNRLIYDGRLRCGSEDVARRQLFLPRVEEFATFHESSTCAMDACWLKILLDPNQSVAFVNTDNVPGLEKKLAGGHLIQNDVEAELISQTSAALLATGVKESSIGVIALYRQQIKLLSQRLRQHNQIEVLTADKSQGRDKDCILMSLTRSNPEHQVGDLLRDWRRLNVCFTRAKVKLIIFGSRRTLTSVPTLKKFLDFCSQHHWILELQKDDHLVHALS
ncbi:Dna2-domain-containing protein, partial [Atractiella rhizophila]